MSRYVNDWATEAVAKQYMKNRRGHSYRRGYLDPPAKYAYLKENAAKRSDAPRGNGKKRTYEGAIAGSSRTKHNETRKIGPPAKKNRLKKQSAPVVGKGKGKAIPEDDEDSDSDEPEIDEDKDDDN